MLVKAVAGAETIRGWECVLQIFHLFFFMFLNYYCYYSYSVFAHICIETTIKSYYYVVVFIVNSFKIQKCVKCKNSRCTQRGQRVL